MFHSVVDTKEQEYSQFAITKDTFEQFIAHLVEQGEKAMDAELLYNAIEHPNNHKHHYHKSYKTYKRCNIVTIGLF